MLKNLTKINIKDDPYILRNKVSHEHITSECSGEHTISIKQMGPARLQISRSPERIQQLCHNIKYVKKINYYKTETAKPTTLDANN